VGRDNAIPRPQDAVSRRYPGAALLPGFVNVHTHLELSGLRGQVDEPDFFDWIRHVRRAKETLPLETYREWALEAVRDAWRHGTTMVADTGTSGAVALALTELGGAGIAYQEAIAPQPERASHALAELRSDVERLRAIAGARVAIGVSPHAPYTVSRALYRKVAAYARVAGLPLAGHVAESPAEMAFVRAGEGPFAAHWRERGIAVGPSVTSPVQLLDELGVLQPGFLAIHVVHTSHADRGVLADAGCSVALCPRSNRRHGHGAAPAASYIEWGIQVGIGTDSLASVDSLDLMADAREVQSLAGLSASKTLELMTLGGARALGVAKETGSLSAGKWADLCVLRVKHPIPSTPDLVAQAMVLAQPSDVLATFVSGRPVYEVPCKGRDRT
jgi:cytosine/adenosine deaminase-related metal-dependent hydrolase